MELGTGCELIEEQGNGDFLIRVVHDPDPREAPHPTVLITANNVDALINCDIWYILQTRRHVQAARGRGLSNEHPGALRFFANKEHCRILRAV
jgi:hypothetical protein